MVLQSFTGLFLTPDAKSLYPTMYPKPVHCYLINLCLWDLGETGTEALYQRLTFTTNSWLFVAADNFQKAQRCLLQEITFSSLALVYVYKHSLKSITK